MLWPTLCYMSKPRLRDRAADELAWHPLTKQEPPNLHRSAIDACMAVPLTDREWNLLETQGFVADIQARRCAPDQAAVIVQQWRDAVGSDQNRRIRGAAGASSLRWEAVSRLVAVEARKTQMVAEFRRRVLNGKTLPPNQMEQWLEVLSKRQQAKPWVKVYASAEEIEQGVVLLGKATQVDYGYDTLEFVVPGSAEVRRILVSSKGIVGWLFWLSDQLAKRYLWRKCHATTFVLTDIPPPIEEPDYEVDSSRAVPALTRVIMRLDPAMSPREVAGLYRQVQLRYFGRRHRSLSPKHVELAKFWSSLQEGAPWKEVMQQWNELHPRWAYKREQNFGRDCVQARRRLLGQNPVRANVRQIASESISSSEGAE